MRIWPLWSDFSVTAKAEVDCARDMSRGREKAVRGAECDVYMESIRLHLVGMASFPSGAQITWCDRGRAFPHICTRRRLLAGSDPGWKGTTRRTCFELGAGCHVISVQGYGPKTTRAAVKCQDSRNAADRWAWEVYVGIGAYGRKPRDFVSGRSLHPVHTYCFRKRGRRNGR